MRLFHLSDLHIGKRVNEFSMIEDQKYILEGILDLAENMIRLSGVHGIDIIETGLRPGEKLYEELLVKTEELDKTPNSMIFIERDTPLCEHDIDVKLEELKAACETEDDDVAREALRKAVPTFRRPEEVNRTAEKSKEMANTRQCGQDLKKTAVV